MEPIYIEAAEHYLWGGDCDGWHLLKDAGLSIIQERVPPGRAEVMHMHRVSRQFFYILEGAALMKTNQGNIHLSKGQGLELPPGTSHQLCNDSDKDVEFLVISAPPSHQDRIDLLP